MNPLNRTIENIVETNIFTVNADMLKGKKLFQIVKYVTGKKLNSHSDYNVEKSGIWYRFDAFTVSGKLGFIRVTLENLFEVVK